MEQIKGLLEEINKFLEERAGFSNDYVELESIGDGKNGDVHRVFDKTRILQNWLGKKDHQ